MAALDEYAVEQLWRPSTGNSAYSTGRSVARSAAGSWAPSARQEEDSVAASAARSEANGVMQDVALSPMEANMRRELMELKSARKHYLEGQAQPGVGCARYFALSPASVRSPRRGVPPPEERSPEAGPHNGDAWKTTKTERWREKGETRWPIDALEELQRQPNQFERAEEVVPLHRGAPTQAAAGGKIYGELWLRSLRAAEGLNIRELGCHNQNLNIAEVAKGFSPSGKGWTGATNPRKSSEARPSTTDWIGRPVAVGRMAIGHMGGTRYEISPRPRPCVPNSMVHVSPVPPVEINGASKQGLYGVVRS